MSIEITLTPKEGKYLTYIYRKQVEGDERTTTTGLARSFRVNPATTTEILQKLAKKNLVEYTRYYGAKLTESGIVEAQKLLRKHRILEILLVEFLSYNSKRACEEASTIDHHCSEDLINAICRTYGHPKRCPCNKKIFSNSECRRQELTEKMLKKETIGDLND